MKQEPTDREIYANKQSEYINYFGIEEEEFEDFMQWYDRCKKEMLRRIIENVERSKSPEPQIDVTGESEEDVEVEEIDDLSTFLNVNRWKEEIEYEQKT